MTTAVYRRRKVKAYKITDKNIEVIGKELNGKIFYGKQLEEYLVFDSLQQKDPDFISATYGEWIVEDPINGRVVLSHYEFHANFLVERPGSTH